MTNNTAYQKDRASRYLYTTGGLVSILFLVYSVATLIIFAMVPEAYPATALECFTMLKENFFIGMLRLDIVSVVVIPFYYLLFFSLYHALKNHNELITKMALFSTLAGVTIFISGLNIMEIVTVSQKYHTATSQEVQQQLLAAGESLLAQDMWLSTGAKVRGILIEWGAVIFSIIMLRTHIFNKATGWVGLIAHSFDLSSEILGIFIPGVKNFFIMFAGPLYLLWFVLIAIRLLQMGSQKE